MLLHDIDGTLTHYQIRNKPVLSRLRYRQNLSSISSPPHNPPQRTMTRLLRILRNASSLTTSLEKISRRSSYPEPSIGSLGRPSSLRNWVTIWIPMSLTNLTMRMTRMTTRMKMAERLMKMLMILMKRCVYISLYHHGFLSASTISKH